METEQEDDKQRSTWMAWLHDMTLSKVLVIVWDGIFIHMTHDDGGGGDFGDDVDRLWWLVINDDEWWSVMLMMICDEW